MTNLAYFMKIRSFPYFFVAGDPNSNKIIFGQFCNEQGLKFPFFPIFSYFSQHTPIFPIF